MSNNKCMTPVELSARWKQEVHGCEEASLFNNSSATGIGASLLHMWTEASTAQAARSFRSQGCLTTTVFFQDVCCRTPHSLKPRTQQLEQHICMHSNQHIANGCVTSWFVASKQQPCLAITAYGFFWQPKPRSQRQSPIHHMHSPMAAEQASQADSGVAVNTTRLRSRPTATRQPTTSNHSQLKCMAVNAMQLLHYFIIKTVQSTVAPNDC
jgi:hypothetical protein